MQFPRLFTGVLGKAAGKRGTGGTARIWGGENAPGSFFGVCFLSLRQRWDEGMMPWMELPCTAAFPTWAGQIFPGYQC